MKKVPSKREIRRQIEQQMLDYIEQGGEVVKVERGTSAYPQSKPGPSTTLFQKPRTSRTPLGEVVCALEARRCPGTTQTTEHKAQTPRKVPIYDDFGEVVRWVWRDDDTRGG